MARVKGCEAVYELAEQWRGRCLLSDRSLLWPDEEEPTWTLENIETFISPFLDKPDHSSETFVQKLKRQIATQPNAIHRLAGDAIALYCLFPRENMGEVAKQNLVDEVTSWKAGQPQDSTLAKSAFSRGLGNPGPAYLTNRPLEIAYTASLAKYLKQHNLLPEIRADELQAAADHVLTQVPSATASRNIALHLLLPEQFEAVASKLYKRKIIGGFEELVGLPEDDEAALRVIRQSVSQRIGRSDFQFWEPDVRPMWDDAGNRHWKIAAGSSAKEWLRFRDGDYIAVDYDILFSLSECPPDKQVFYECLDARSDAKVSGAGKFQLRQFVYEMREGDLVCVYDSSQVLGHGQITTDYSFDPSIDEYAHRRGVQWESISPVKTAGVPENLQRKLSQNKTIVELGELEFLEAIGRTGRVWIETVNSWQSSSNPAVKTATAHAVPTKSKDGKDIWKTTRALEPGDVILHLVDTKCFKYRSVVAASFNELDGSELGESGQWYFVPLEKTEEIAPPLDWASFKLSKHGQRLKEFAESTDEKLFCLDNLELYAPEKVTRAPKQVIAILNDAYQEKTGSYLLPPGWPATTPTNRLESLAARTYLPITQLTELESLVQDRKQIILEGPPGSGKTYLARLFARYLAGVPLDAKTDERVEIVQFHQSYGYEDFVAGIRPKTVDGQIRYDVQPGIFLEMCDRARANPDETFVLIIDEINRGNLSRIFGELLYAIEYRDQPVRLQYPDLAGDESADHMTIPENLLLIGTMNSTDRSLALVDYALRRRFYFWKLLPVVGDDAPVLRKWLAAQGIDSGTASALVQRFVVINARVAELLSPDHQIGHSYLMKAGIADVETQHREWHYAIEPLLQEYFHTRKNRAELIEELRAIWFGTTVPHE